MKVTLLGHYLHAILAYLPDLATPGRYVGQLNIYSCSGPGPIMRVAASVSGARINYAGPESWPYTSGDLTKATCFGLGLMDRDGEVLAEAAGELEADPVQLVLSSRVSLDCKGRALDLGWFVWMQPWPGADRIPIAGDSSARITLRRGEYLLELAIRREDAEDA